MKHGGDLFAAKARYGEDGPPWLDLSTGLNPHPWPVPENLRRAGWERLPGEAAMRSLLAAARTAYRVPEAAAIVAASGTQALIQWLPRLAPPGAVAVLGPTYAEHAASWRQAGRAVLDAPDPSPPGEGSGVARDDGRRPTHRVVVNPNNPDGRVLGLPVLAAMAEECGRAGGWLVVDEAYADLDPVMTAARLVPDRPVIVLRSFGKFYGLAGLRLGFAIARPEVADGLRAALGDWAVSGPALAVGAAALADEAWADSMRLRLAAEAARLDEILLAAGLALAGGTSLYRLVRHPDNPAGHRNLHPPHAEVPAEGRPRSTHDRAAFFEAPGPSPGAPQGEDGGSFRPDSQAQAIHERLAAKHIWCRRFDWAPDLLRFGLPPDEAGLVRLGEALAHAQGTSTASSRKRAR